MSAVNPAHAAGGPVAIPIARRRAPSTRRPRTIRLNHRPRRSAASDMGIRANTRTLVNDLAIRWSFRRCQVTPLRIVLAHADPQSNASPQRRTLLGRPSRPGPRSGAIRNAFHKATADTGGEFAWEWGLEASLDEIRGVLTLPTRRVPPDIDLLLLVAADPELGFLRDNPDLKGPLRLGFKAELEKVLAERERATGAAGNVDPAMTS